MKYHSPIYILWLSPLFWPFTKVNFVSEMLRYHLPIYVLCVSSHFWPFTKVNFVLPILQKSWDSVRPLPPGWDKIPSLSKEKNFWLPLHAWVQFPKPCTLKWMCQILGLPPNAASSRLDAFAGPPLQVPLNLFAGDDSTFKTYLAGGSACSLEGGINLPWHEQW